MFSKYVSLMNWQGLERRLQSFIPSERKGILIPLVKYAKEINYLSIYSKPHIFACNSPVGIVLSCNTSTICKTVVLLFQRMVNKPID